MIERTTGRKITRRKEKEKRNPITDRGKSTGRGTLTPTTAGKMSTTDAKDEMNDRRAVILVILEGV